MNDKKRLNILHYSLGFPPYRTGGMTKFCMDLMHQQLKEGHIVSLLWPGKIGFSSGKTVIKHHKSIDGIGDFEVINPTPVSYDEGIQDIEVFKRPGNRKVYDDFLKELQPDVIHIHTLMGLNKSFLESAKAMSIRVVFTAHDFFPICPKVTMFRKGQICSSVETCKDCPSCNTTALSISKIKLLQSPLYRKLKDSSIVKKLRKGHRDNYLSEQNIDCENSVSQNNDGDYKELRAYFDSLLDCVDIIHFNSSVTKDVYENFLGEKKSVIIPITHADICDNRVKKSFGDKLKITYMGPQSAAKGYFLLKDALDDLWKERQDFCLNVFFKPISKSPYIMANERYSYNQLKSIFENTDVLVTPSIWYETFGYTVLEALSFGVPVVITKNVGAKDIIPQGAGIVVSNLTADDVKKAINSLTPEKLGDMNKVIINSVCILTLADMSEQIYIKCY